MGMRRRARRRGLIAGAAVGGAIAHHRGKQQAQAEYDQQAEQAPPAPAYNDGQNVPPPALPADELEHLAQLHSSGVLTDEEFAAAKAKVLGN